MYGKEGIEYLESAYADLLFSDYTVDEEAKTITPKKGIEFKSRQAIVCFELEDTNGNTIKAKTLLIHDAHGVMRSVNGAADGYDLHTFGDVTVTSTEYSGDYQFWVALCHVLDTSILQLTATTPDGDVYMYNVTGEKEVGKLGDGINDGGLEHGKYYEIKVKMVKALDLSTVTEETTIQDGMTLTGKLAAGGSIILENGTYTLAGVDINSDNTITDGKSGISCIGNVTLNLKGTNKVKGLNEDYPGIWIKENFTLEIKGDGSLEASSDNGAGIGCASYTIDTEKDCGSIVITSGTITATSEGAAGIGAGHTMNDSSCGDITIGKDAVVTAKGGDEAAAIGTASGSSSGYSYCNSITIKSGATVTVTKSNNTEEAIGKGNGGSMRKENPVTIEEGANVTINGAE